MNSTFRRLLRWAGPLLALAALLSVPVSAHAQELFVDCVADPATLPPGTYPTIHTAIAAIGGNFFNVTVTVVASPCPESGVNVDLSNRQDITVQAPEGQTAVITNEVFISGSRRIVLRRLIIRSSPPPGSGGGINVVESRDVKLEDVTVENHARAGLLAQNSLMTVQGQFVSQQNGAQGVSLNNSTISFFGPVTIMNNLRGGLSADTNSVVTMGGDDGTMPVRISGNQGGGGGILVNNGSFVRISGDTIFEDNAGTAINVIASRVVIFAQLSQNIARNNGGGIAVSDSSSLFLDGNNLIQNNGQVGILVNRGSSLLLSPRTRPGGSTVGTTIEGHTLLGITAVQEVSVQINGPHKIRNNGFGATLPAIAGGIRVNRGSLALTGAMELTGNNGPGIRVELGGKLAVGFVDGGPPEAMITGNAAEGILITELSAVRLFQSATISGNGVASISCDKSSWLFGDTTGIADIICTNIEADKAKK